MRLKRVNCIDKEGKDLNLIMAREYNRDHKDIIHFQKIPKGYKIIGIRGFKYINGEQMLHLADFQIWKPPPDWLSYKSLVQRLADS